MPCELLGCTGETPSPSCPLAHSFGHSICVENILTETWSLSKCLHTRCGDRVLALFYTHFLTIRAIMGWQDGSVGKHTASTEDLALILRIHRVEGEKQILQPCPLTFISVLLYMWTHTQTHTHTQAHTLMHTHMHTQVHARTCTHTH